MQTAEALTQESSHNIRSCRHKNIPSPEVHADSYRPLLSVNSELHGCESLSTASKCNANMTRNAGDRGEQVANPVGPKCIILVCCHITNNPHQVPLPGPVAELGLTKCHAVLVSDAEGLHRIFYVI